MCILFVYTLLKVVRYYDLSVLSMLVMGFQKKRLDGGWVSGWGELYPSLFWNFFNFAKPLSQSITRPASLDFFRGTQYVKKLDCSSKSGMVGRSVRSAYLDILFRRIHYGSDIIIVSCNFRGKSNGRS